jgi:hypothetical protein
VSEEITLEDIAHRLIKGRPPPEEIEKAVRRAIRKREKGQELIDKGNEELALWTAVGRATRALPMTRLAEIANLSREFVYKIQREHGLGVKGEGNGKAT